MNQVPGIACRNYFLFLPPLIVLEHRFFIVGYLKFAFDRSDRKLCFCKFLRNRLSCAKAVAAFLQHCLALGRRGHLPHLLFPLFLI